MNFSQQPTSKHWSEGGYRCCHDRIRLDPLMLTNQFEKPIDGQIVNFTEEYPLYRLQRLLEPFEHEDKLIILNQAYEAITAELNGVNPLRGNKGETQDSEGEHF